MVRPEAMLLAVVLLACVGLLLCAGDPARVPRVRISRAPVVAAIAFLMLVS
jgi:hypothetical protein